MSWLTIGAPNFSGKKRGGNFMTKNSKNPSRRTLLKTGLAAGYTAIASFAVPLRPLVAGVRDRALAPRILSPDVPSFELDEITIAELQAAMTAGKYTARSITEKYLTRIDQIDKQGPAINAVIE